MKRYLLGITLTILLAVSAYAVDTTFIVKGAYLLPSNQTFLPSEMSFKDFYTGGLMYGGEVNIGISKSIVLWAGGAYFTQSGEMSFTKEDTTVQIFPIGGGLKFRLTSGAVDFYLGGGIRYYNFKESGKAMDVVKKGGIGYLGTIGGLIKAGNFLIDLFVNYSYCKMTPKDYTINIGGIEAGIGIGFLLK